MKKTVFTLLVLFISISITAQKGGPEKPAKKVADEMTEVLVLNDTESKKVYEIQLNKFRSVQAAKKEHADNKDAIKAETKIINKGVQKELLTVLGSGKMSTWKAHVKANKKKKK